MKAPRGFAADGSPVRARRFYRVAGRLWERVFVVGWSEVGGEWWCRVRFKFRDSPTAGILCHPSGLLPEGVFDA